MAAAAVLAAALTVVPAVGASALPGDAITTNGALPGATAGTPYSLTVETNFGATVLALLPGKPVPPGLRIEGMNIVGTPTTAGQYSGELVAAAGLLRIAYKKFTLTVSPMALTGATVGQPFTATLPRPSGSNPSWALAQGSSLPAGLTLNSDGTISGTPSYNSSYGASKRFDFTVAVSGSGAAGVVRSFSLVVTTPTPTVAVTGSADAWLGQPYSATVTTTGPGATTTVTGLPAGLSLANGVISGTPTTAGDYTAQVTATNTAGSDVEPLTISVNAAPIITGSELGNAVVGSNYSGSVTASGKNVVFTATGLPQGVSIDASTGAVTGNFPAAGLVEFTVTATNPSGSDSEPYSLTAYIAPVIENDSLGFAVVGEDFDAQVEASGLGVTYSSTDLPATLTLDSATGAITGSLAEGDYTFTVTASNFAGSIPQTYTVTSYSAPVIKTTALAPGIVGSKYDQAIAATGNGATATVTAGELPAGLTLSASGVLSGSPTAAGQSTFTVTVENPAGSDSQTYLLVVSQPAQQLSSSQVGQGGQLMVVGTGFQPNEAVQVWLHSTPVLLTTVTANANGAFATTVTIPAATPAGAHQIESRGTVSGSQWTNLTVTAAGTTAGTGSATGSSTTAGGLASTGSEFAPYLDGGVALLLLGGLLMMIARRRQAVRS